MRDKRNKSEGDSSLVSENYSLRVIGDEGALKWHFCNCVLITMINALVLGSSPGCSICLN